MEGLVDLSLFEWNPTGTSSAHGVSSGNAEYYRPVSSGTKEFYAPLQSGQSSYETKDIQEALRRSIHESLHRSEAGQVRTSHDEDDIRETIVDANRRREVAPRPLTALPRTRVGQEVVEDGSESVLKRTKRTAIDQVIPSPGSLLQRRNANTPPQLTLSVPYESPQSQNNHSDRNGNPPPMVWMPDEQMWLVVGEAEQRSSTAAQGAYPTPPTYTPQAFTRSEPTSRKNSQWDLTPPQTPIQSQLQSLLQPRDEERLSPLFQEAMNSVPMNDHFDLPPPPSYEGSVRRSPPTQLRPHTSASERFLSSLTPSRVVHRAQTTGSHRPRVRSDTSNERSNGQRSYSTFSASVFRPSKRSGSYHSTNSSRSYQTRPDMTSNSYRPVPAVTRPWHGLAQKLARPKSTT